MSSSERRPLVSCSPFALLVIIVFVAAWFGWREARRLFHPANDPDAAPRAVTARGDLAEDEKSTIELFKRASPSVVFINTKAAVLDRFRMRAMEFPLGSGSGFVWDERGYIVTNYHVVKDASHAFVTLSDQKTYPAEHIYPAPDYDIAVLKIDAPKSSLPALAIGTSNDLQVGQKVFAIGNPFGLDHTLTTGVISALEREINSVTGSRIRGVIQLDAAINPGNSGGPLLDSAGRLIGMNTAIANPVSQAAGVEGWNTGIGFAIPVDTINQIAPELMRRGILEPPRLGGVRPFSDALAAKLGIKGLAIQEVDPGSPAEKAGLRSMDYTPEQELIVDVIVAVDGQRIARLADLRDVLRDHKPGDIVDVDVVRAGRKLRMKVPLQ
jgi:S1-C subfamily serine protease